MSQAKDLLKQKIEANYAEYKERWLQMSPAQLIDGCGEVKAVTHMAKVLPDSVSDDEAEYLLRFKNSLEVVSDVWDDYTGFDSVIDEELHHVLWDLMDKGDAEVDYEMEPGDQTQGPVMEM